jgi:hypothetical protein
MAMAQTFPMSLMSRGSPAISAQSRTLFTTLISRSMSSDPIAVPFRLSKSQMSVIWPGLDRIVNGYSRYRNPKLYQHSFPFKIRPPAPGFDRGTRSDDFMDQIVELWKRLRPKARAGGRVRMDAIEIRAAVLAIRVNLDWWRVQRHMARNYAERAKLVLAVDPSTISKRERKAKQTIRSLERHLKRANYRLLAEVERQSYHAYMAKWRAHVRWIRLHLVYFKPFRPFRLRSKKFYQEILIELEKIARVAIAEEGYEQPSAAELRRVMRLFTFSSRRGRQGKIDILYMLQNERSNLTKMNLAKFILDRLELKPVPEM